MKPYPKFWWRTSWMEYELSLPDEVRHQLSTIIMIYGIHAVYDGGLEGEVLKYFMEKIKPDLDKQHKRMDKGLEP